MFRGALMWISRLIVTGSSHRSVQSGIRGFSERLVEAGTADKVNLVEESSPFLVETLHGP